MVATMTSAKLYEGFTIYRRLSSSEVVAYRCFKLLSDGRFTVQSADWVRLPIQPADLRQHEDQFWDLLCEDDPSRRSGLFDTIEEAIADFETAFEE